MASKIKRIKTDASTCLSDFVQNIQRKRLLEGKSVTDFKFNKKRARFLSSELLVPEDCKGVVYWMFRDCRVQDNWAFLFAQKLALKNEVPLHVCFCLLPKFLDAAYRHYHFLLKGLEDVAVECSSLNISFHLLEGSAQQILPEWVKNQHIGAVVCDFSPLRLPMSWCDALNERLPKDVPFIQVDAHNIVPCWVASDKLEYSARTIRKKITSKLDEFLTDFPPVIEHPFKAELEIKPIDWNSALESRDVDKSIKPCEWAKPGTNEGLKVLEEFCNERLKLFASKRNDPTIDALSNLSPWFHFGQVSIQRAVLCVQELKKKHTESVNAFCEEAIVRRELSDNFCFYNQQYDNIQGTNDWARTTLTLHSKDKRSHIYTLQQFEKATTHDDLWNSAQLQLVEEGKMHGFLRMYWAKKILEWTPSPETALEYSIYLNDRYSLDGRDPNGYVGCMWSICGIHDQGWAERAIFGKIRYMNYEGCKRKFDIKVFVKKYGGIVH